MATPSSTSQTRGFLALLYVTVCTFATLYAPQPLLSSIQNAFPGLSDSTVALCMTMTLGPLSVAPLLYGAFLSSLNARHVLLVCVLLMGVGNMGLWLCSSFGGLLALRLLQGLVIPAVLTCIMAHIAAKFHGAPLQRALAVYVGVTIAGGLFGRSLAGLLATYWGWRSVFLVLGLAQLVSMLPLLRLESKAENHFARVRLREFRDIAATPGVLRLLLVDACGFFVFVGISSYLPFFLTQGDSQISEWRISLMYLGYGVGIIMALASRRIAAWAGGEVKAIMLGMAVYFCAMPGFVLGGTAVIFFTMCLVCTGQFLEHSTTPGLVNRMAARDKGAVNGLYLSVYYMGGALGSYVPGLIFSWWGWQTFIICLSLMLLLTLWLARGVQRHVPKD